MDDLPKIECTTVVTWRNTKTGEVFKEKKDGPDIAQDVTVQVSPKGLDILQGVMKKHNERKP
jgi:hypothetical protein